ncbi:MAG: hypothetical protein ABEJ28_07045 [Salinigranum sp.]
MPAMNPRDNDRHATIDFDADGELYAHVSLSDDETIIYNPDATDEWIQSTGVRSLAEWE